MSDNPPRGKSRTSSRAEGPVPDGRTAKTRFWATLPGLLTALATFLAATGGLLGGLAAVGLIGGGGDGTGSARPSTSPAAPAALGAGTSPIVARLEFSQGAGFMRGFFTPKGFIVVAGGDLYGPTVRDVEEAVWTDGGDEQHARVSLVRLSTSPPVALLRLVDGSGPQADFPIRAAFTLHPGDPVSALIGPRDRNPGKVIGITERDDRLNNRLITTPLSFPGDAGAPVVDKDGSVVAMIFVRQYPSNNAESVPIESIRATFPDAF